MDSQKEKKNFFVMFQIKEKRTDMFHLITNYPLDFLNGHEHSPHDLECLLSHWISTISFIPAVDVDMLSLSIFINWTFGIQRFTLMINSKNVTVCRTHALQADLTAEPAACLGCTPEHSRYCLLPSRDFAPLTPLELMSKGLKATGKHDM